MMAGDTSAAAPSPDPLATGAEPGDLGTEFMDLLAYIYLQHGLPDKAAVLLSARDLLVPDDARALLTLALALVRSAKPGKALETLERLAMLGAMRAEFHLVRAQALQALERHAEAASAMRAYVAMLPAAAPPPPAAPSASA